MKRKIVMKKKVVIAPLISLALLAVFALSCLEHPTYEGNAFAVEEQFSVWQYLSVYSIFQERVPPSEVASHTSADTLLYRMFDTLRNSNDRYTRYIDPPQQRPPGNIDVGDGVIIPADTVVAVTPSTAYFRFRQFDNVAENVFRRHIDYMSEFDNIVIDVRENGGGLVSVVTNMLSEFLPFNTDYIEYHFRRYDRNERAGVTDTAIYRTGNRDPKLRGKNIVLLVNRNSASASEILAAALIDRADALMIGARTLGKAIGQLRIPRQNRRMLLITHMEIRGLTERTNNYHRIGIEPDAVDEAFVREAETELADLHAGLYDLFNRDADLYFAIKSAEPQITETDDEETLRALDRFINFTRRSPWLLGRRAESLPFHEIGLYIETPPDPLIFDIDFDDLR